MLGTLPTGWMLLFFGAIDIVNSLPHKFSERQAIPDDAVKRDVGDRFTIATSRWDLTCYITYIGEPRMVYTDDEAQQSFGDLYEAIQANPTRQTAQSNTPASGKNIHNTLTMYVDYTLNRYTASDYLNIVTILGD